MAIELQIGVRHSGVLYGRSITLTLVDNTNTRRKYLEISPKKQMNG